MSAPPSGKGEPITGKRELVEYLEQGCKPRAAWRIGTEHEKFGFTREDLRPLPYDGPRSIRALLEGLADAVRLGSRCSRTATRSRSPSRAATSAWSRAASSSCSGAPLETLHQTCCEAHTHLDEVKKIAEPLGIGMLGMGFQPKWRREDIPWMPKGRYAIMGAYMPKVGRLGLDMMLRTCTVQVNLDFASEADMVRKFRVSLALQPIATALFANSPFVEGRPVGLSQLSQPHLDRHRPGPLGHAAVRVRARHGLRALCRLGARRADVLRLPRRAATSTPAASRSATSWPAGCRRCRASGRRSATGPTI